MDRRSQTERRRLDEERQARSRRPAIAAAPLSGLTIFPDPQKREGKALPTPDGFQFTDANSGDRYVIKTSDGKIVGIAINDLSITIRN